MTILLRHGADINLSKTIPPDKKRSALGAAVKGGKVSTVRLLLEEGADVKSHAFAWEHCRRLALAKRGIDPLRILVTKGAVLELHGDSKGLSEWKTKKIQKIMALQGIPGCEHVIHEGSLSPAEISESDEDESGATAFLEGLEMLGNGESKAAIEASFRLHVR